MIADARVWKLTNGSVGIARQNLPEPKLESSLNRAPDLEAQDVQAILDAMHMRDRAQTAIEASAALGILPDEAYANAIFNDGIKVAESLAKIISRLEAQTGISWKLAYTVN